MSRQTRLFMKRIPAILFSVMSLLFVLSGCALLNRYQTDGEVTLQGLGAPVQVLRDEKGMAYIHAKTIDDALMAQGFVTAQDRLFQMELMRLLASGRISEVTGEKGLPMDIRMRTLDFIRHATIHAEILAPETRFLFEKYIDGVNAYISFHPDTHHLEFKLAGIRPSLWTIADALSILYFMSWQTAGNLQTEIIAQMLIEKIGAEKAREIFPININTDDEALDMGNHFPISPEVFRLRTSENGPGDDFPGSSLNLGSNNWVVAADRSASGKPILANDPHLDARILPGPWYPCGIITPGRRAVGAGIPGIPGMVVFRTEYITVGITNAYGDCQDLYVETPDPNDPGRYLEGSDSLPFIETLSVFKIKDKDAPGGFRETETTIRRTRRGPVVSECFPKFKTDKIVTLRWAPLETMAPIIGLERLLFARSAKEIRGCLSDVNLIMLNFVFADHAGNFGWQTSGKLPIRVQQDGNVPYPVTGTMDNWNGWIPFEEMPAVLNPDKGWIATCNNAGISRNYPYYYSSFFSSSYRYRRIRQLLEPPGIHSADDNWRYQLDDKNLMAEIIAPIMARALLTEEETAAMGRLLAEWDSRDSAGLAAPLVFQEIYRTFAKMTFQDELGDELAAAMLENWYFWQERLQKMVVNGNSPWFDDIRTRDLIETRDDLLRRAGKKARQRLTETLGANPENWKWGKQHQLEFVSPLRREGIGKGLLGGGTHPASGSGETLLRGRYAFDDPYQINLSASLRMVADMGDPDKVLAVLPGGVTGRLFHPHTTDQIEKFMSGEKAYWWFSDAAIAAHAETTLTLKP